VVFVSSQTPLFPLNTVVFPGAVVPLHIFEDRYRQMMADLLSIPDPIERRFGILTIREGYEVGDHGRQSLYTMGTLVQLNEVDEEADGTYQIEATALSRMQVLETSTEKEYLTGLVEVIEEPRDTVPQEIVVQVTNLFQRYRAHLSGVFGAQIMSGSLPSDASYLSYALASECLLTLPQKQSLLEESDVETRLRRLHSYISGELRAMQAIPSLPATEVARTRWSPN
jgi:Lon protease-like protein